MKRLIKKWSALTTSKKILWFIIALAVQVIVFAEVAMIVTGDLSALYALIGGTVTLSVGGVIEYMWKSTKENTKGGIVYDKAMMEQEPITLPYTEEELETGGGA